MPGCPWYGPSAGGTDADRPGLGRPHTPGEEGRCFPPLLLVSVRSKPQQPESAQPVAQSVGTLVSVNVGMPKNVPWKGKDVYTGVFKDPVSGHRRVGKLNIEGDGQGDRAGHGGEQRAVFVYQIDSYRYWERELGRHDFVYGQFGENFTVEGPGDDEVCIGDRYQIATATFGVTQPRVTCYRVGIRMSDPRIPALLVSHHRPGFYFRVLEEGEVSGRRDHQACFRPRTDAGR
jgi:MOSC domain-containing protein YiiM